MSKIHVEIDTDTKKVTVLQIDKPVTEKTVVKGCETCRWARGGYCEEPTGNSCNWVGELFYGRGNNWPFWKPKV